MKYLILILFLGTFIATLYFIVTYNPLSIITGSLFGFLLGYSRLYEYDFEITYKRGVQKLRNFLLK